MTLPYISQLQAVNVANGAMISCSVSGNNQETRHTTICIIGNGCGNNYLKNSYIGPQIVAPELNVTEWYEPSGVVVTVEWTRENTYSVSYNVSTFPEFPLTFIGDTSVKMAVPYNTQFMMNVSAMLCESHMTTAKNFFHIELEQDK